MNSTISNSTTYKTVEFELTQITKKIKRLSVTAEDHVASVAATVIPISPIGVHFPIRGTPPLPPKVVAKPLSLGLMLEEAEAEEETAYCFPKDVTALKLADLLDKYLLFDQTLDLPSGINLAGGMRTVSIDSSIAFDPEY